VRKGEYYKTGGSLIYGALISSEEISIPKDKG
jgi:hypothetical protein